jgi:hypothetical protein
MQGCHDESPRIRTSGIAVVQIIVTASLAGDSRTVDAMDESIGEERETPFDSIEGAHEYVTLLAEALEEAHEAVHQDAAVASKREGAERRLQALQIVEYKLTQLREHLICTRWILNDLRTLRRAPAR